MFFYDNKVRSATTISLSMPNNEWEPVTATIPKKMSFNQCSDKINVLLHFIIFSKILSVFLNELSIIFIICHRNNG